MRIIAFFGRKKSGKTTIISEIVKLLTADGKTVGVIKHINEPDFEVDKPETDTSKFFNVGSNVVIGVSSQKLFVHSRLVPTIDVLIRISSELWNLDYLLLEGFSRFLGRNETVEKVIILRSIEDAYDYRDVAKPISAILLRKEMPVEEFIEIFGDLPYLICVNVKECVNELYQLMFSSKT